MVLSMGSRSSAGGVVRVTAVGRFSAVGRVAFCYGRHWVYLWRWHFFFVHRVLCMSWSTCLASYASVIASIVAVAWLVACDRCFDRLSLWLGSVLALEWVRVLLRMW